MCLFLCVFLSLSLSRSLSLSLTLSLSRSLVPLSHHCCFQICYTLSLTLSVSFKSVSFPIEIISVKFTLLSSGLPDQFPISPKSVSPQPLSIAHSLSHSISHSSSILYPTLIFQTLICSTFSFSFKIPCSSTSPALLLVFSLSVTLSFSHPILILIHCPLALPRVHCTTLSTAGRKYNWGLSSSSQ